MTDIFLNDGNQFFIASFYARFSLSAYSVHHHAIVSRDFLHDMVRDKKVGFRIFRASWCVSVELVMESVMSASLNAYRQIRSGQEIWKNIRTPNEMVS